jgi:hypothetical protein
METLGMETLGMSRLGTERGISSRDAPAGSVTETHGDSGVNACELGVTLVTPKVGTPRSGARLP